MPSLRLPDLSNTRFPSLAMPVVTGLLWCAAAASVAWWVLQFAQGSGTANAPVALRSAPVAQASVQTTSPVARALGGVAASESSAAPQSARYQLLGVIAANSGQGSALIGIDGQPPKAFVQGQTVVDGWQVKQVNPKQVQLSSTSGSFWLSLPTQSP